MVEMLPLSNWSADSAVAVTRSSKGRQQKGAGKLSYSHSVATSHENGGRLNVCTHWHWCWSFADRLTGGTITGFLSSWTSFFSGPSHLPSLIDRSDNGERTYLPAKKLTSFWQRVPSVDGRSLHAVTKLGTLRFRATIKVLLQFAHVTKIASPN